MSKKRQTRTVPAGDYIMSIPQPIPTDPNEQHPMHAPTKPVAGAQMHSHLWLG